MVSVFAIILRVDEFSITVNSHTGHGHVLINRKNGQNTYSIFTEGKPRASTHSRWIMNFEKDVTIRQKSHGG